MAMTKIPDVAYEVKDDIINLEQDIGCGEVHSIGLHRIHFDHIASKLGAPDLSVSAEKVMRKLEVVSEKLNQLVYSEVYRKPIIQASNDGLDFIKELDLICELADEFMNDIRPANNGELVKAQIE